MGIDKKLIEFQKTSQMKFIELGFLMPIPWTESI